MKKVAENKCGKCAVRLMLIVVLMAGCVPALWAGVYQRGTVVRMRMGDCLPAHRGFMLAFGGPQPMGTPEVCPEYTLVSEKVVYVIVGSSSGQLVPLADAIDFRMHNNEIVVRIDDAKRESKFTIKEMILRSEWDLVQKHVADQLSAPEHEEDGLAMRRRR
jgi:hypothetical protein